MSVFFFFFNDTATTEIYTLSLHDALPISRGHSRSFRWSWRWSSVTSSPGKRRTSSAGSGTRTGRTRRSEEHTSELQSQSNLVCRLLLEKKNNYSVVIGNKHLPLHAAVDCC